MINPQVSQDQLITGKVSPGCQVQTAPVQATPVHSLHDQLLRKVLTGQVPPIIKVLSEAVLPVHTTLRQVSRDQVL